MSCPQKTNENLLDQKRRKTKPRTLNCQDLERQPREFGQDFG